jgi:hypothetical protein
MNLGATLNFFMHLAQNNMYYCSHFSYRLFIWVRNIFTCNWRPSHSSCGLYLWVRNIFTSKWRPSHSSCGLYLWVRNIFTSKWRPIHCSCGLYLWIRNIFTYKWRVIKPSLFCFRTCPTKTSTGMRPASFATSAVSPWWISSSAPRPIRSTVATAMIHSSPPVAMDAAKSSEPVSANFSCQLPCRTVPAQKRVANTRGVGKNPWVGWRWSLVPPPWTTRVHGSTSAPVRHLLAAQDWCRQQTTGFLQDMHLVFCWPTEILLLVPAVTFFGWAKYI